MEMAHVCQIFYRHMKDKDKDQSSAEIAPPLGGEQGTVHHRMEVLEMRIHVEIPALTLAKKTSFLPR